MHLAPSLHASSRAFRTPTAATACQREISASAISDCHSCPLFAGKCRRR
jgi:hypothetical protein